MKQFHVQNPGRDIITIARGAGIVFAGTIIGSGLRYIFQVIAARNLGAQFFGIFFLGFAVFKVAGMVSELGLPNGLLKYVALYRGEGDQRRVKGMIILAVRIAAAASVIIAILLIVFSKPAAVKLFHNPELTNVLRIFALALPFTTLTTVLLFSTQAFKVMKYKVVVREILEPFLRIIAIIILLAAGLKLYGAVAAYSIPLAASAVLAFYCLKKVFPGISSETLLPIYETRKLVDFSWPLSLVKFFGVSMLWIDTLLIGFFKTSRDVGIFSAAQRTALLVSLIKVSFDSIFAPVISDIYNRGEILRLEEYFKTVTKWIFAFSLPLFLLIAFFARSILGFFGPEFIEGSSCLFILSTAWLIYAGVGSVGQIIIMTGRQRLHLLNIICVLFLNVILNLILIPKYGITGASAATFAAISLMGVIELIQVYAFLKIQPYRVDYFKPLAAGGISLLVLFILSESLGYPARLESMILGSLVFLIVYGLSLFAFGLQEEDRIILIKVREKIFKR